MSNKLSGPMLEIQKVEPRSKKIVLAFSGGLDTSYCVIHLQKEGWEVTTATVDTGGFSHEELQAIEAQSKRLGAASHHTVDAREELFNHFIRYLIYGNVMRGNTYPLSVAAERICQAQSIVKLAQSLGAQAIAHGSTGAGNDQIRFDVTCRTLAPHLQIITPVRDQHLERSTEVSRLRAHGINLPEKAADYSINQGLWGTTVGGKETLTSWHPLPEHAWPSKISSDLEDQTISVDFEQGIPIALNQKSLPPVPLIRDLETIASPYGIGRGIHCGETILGIKGRVGFQASAAILLISMHRELEKLVLSGLQLQWKEILGNQYGSLLHEAKYFDPLARDIESFLRSSQLRVSGRVHATLYPRTYAINGVRSPYSQMEKAGAKYGESSSLWTGQEARAFAKIYGISQVIATSVDPSEASSES